MKKEEHTEIVQNLRKLMTTEKPDIAQITDLLSTLSEDYGTQIATVSDFSLKNEKLVNDNVKLQNVNMELFLKVGQTVPTTTENKPIETPKFETLFNEKGELI